MAGQMDGWIDWWMFLSNYMLNDKAFFLPLWYLLQGIWEIAGIIWKVVADEVQISMCLHKAAWTIKNFKKHNLTRQNRAWKDNRIYERKI